MKISVSRFIANCKSVITNIQFWRLICQYNKKNTQRIQGIHKKIILNEPLQREPAAPVHSVASRQLTGGNIVHLMLPSVIVSGTNSAICSNGQTWKLPPGPIHHTFPLREGCKTIPFHCRDHHSSKACPFPPSQLWIMLASRMLRKSCIVTQSSFLWMTFILVYRDNVHVDV